MEHGPGGTHRSALRGRLSASSALWLLACSGAAEDKSDHPAGQAGTGGATAVLETPGVEVLHEGEDEPYAVALDDRYLYWASAAGLRRAPIDGGEPVTLATLDSVQQLVPAGEHLYFQLAHSYARGEVGRVYREDGAAEWFANDSSPRGLAVNADGVYWAVSTNSVPGRLYRAGLDGSGVSEELATGLAYPEHLALQGAQLYFADGSSCQANSPPPCVEAGIFRIPLTGGLPERVVSTEARSNPIWNEESMYWLAGAPRASLVLAQPPGGTPQPIARMLMESPPGNTNLASDAEAIYWVNGTTVLRMPFATGEVARLVSGLEETNGMALRGGWVYVAERPKGRILRITTDGSAYRPAAEPITGPCPTPVGSAEELALTPRADPNIELLGFELEPDNVVVTQATYERLVDDVTAIRALQTSLTEVTYSYLQDGQRFQLEWTAAAAQAFAEGRYTAWDCLNAAYGLTSAIPLSNGVQLELEGIYNLPLVFERYRQLPGVTGGVSGLGGAPGPTICVSREAERYEYVFDDNGGGPCFGTCPRHRAFHFASESSGQVTELAEWDSTTGAPSPQWFEDLCGFRPRVGDY